MGNGWKQWKPEAKILLALGGIVLAAVPALLFGMIAFFKIDEDRKSAMSQPSTRIASASRSLMLIASKVPTTRYSRRNALTTFCLETVSSMKPLS